MRRIFNLFHNNQVMYKCVILVICIFVVYASAESVSVVTELGTIVGQKKDGYNTFLGIPYAKVNESNPFGKTIVYPNFKVPFIANDSSVACPQVIFKVSGTIQCLRLNIYVPNSAEANSKIPILVWIHGGGFEYGYAGEYGGEYLVKRDIIVITINYRVGPYGFFCLHDPSVSGNQGMKDQIEALRWVKKNINAFGGDPNKVTIAGQSFGGGSVDLHLYSEFETLFDKAIVQSGSIYDEGFYVRPDTQAAIKIAQYLGHNVTKTNDALKVLARDDPREVMSAALKLNIRTRICNEKYFKDVQSFVRSDPFHLDKPNRISQTKFMIGYTSMEFLEVFGNKPKEFWDNLGDRFVDELNENFILTTEECLVLSNIIKKFYLGGKPVGPESTIELSEVGSDFAVNYSEERSIDKYIQSGADGMVYKYLFSYIGGSVYKNITGSGASHSEELKYLFEWQAPIVSNRVPVVGAEQMLIRDRMTSLWANFVKFGNPTPEPTPELPITWTPVRGATRPYLNIDVELTMQDHVYHRRMAFWDMIWHMYEKKSVIYDGPTSS